MTKEMRLIFEKGKWNDKRDTPAAAPPPCRLHFLMFSALHAEKAALLRRKNAFGRTTALLAPRMPSQNKKAIPYGMTFCFGGDKRDRTADLMTASCYRFVIWSVFASNTSVQSTKSAGFCKVLSIASTRFCTLGSESGSVLCCRIFVAEQAVRGFILFDFRKTSDRRIEAVIRIVVVALADLTQ